MTDLQQQAHAMSFGPVAAQDGAARPSRPEALLPDGALTDPYVLDLFVGRRPAA